MGFWVFLGEYSSPSWQRFHWHHRPKMSPTRLRFQGNWAVALAWPLLSSAWHRMKSLGVGLRHVWCGICRFGTIHNTTDAGFLGFLHLFSWQIPRFYGPHLHSFPGLSFGWVFVQLSNCQVALRAFSRRFCQGKCYWRQTLFGVPTFFMAPTDLGLGNCTYYGAKWR